MIKDLAKTLREPLLNYILNNHMEEVDELFTDYIEEFLFIQLGDLNENTRKKLTKELLKQVL